MQTQDRERIAQLREIIDLLLHSMRLHHRIVERRMECFGVHHSQHRMLMKLSSMGRIATQKDIAAAMDVSPACVARTLKPLNAAGLIEKSDGEDARCNEISISPEGRRLVEDSLALFRRIDDEMFEGISGEELAMLGGVLKRVQVNLLNMDKSETGGEGSV